ncbi:hypothetical protein ACJX0J_019584 [Zea mays]
MSCMFLILLSIAIGIYVQKGNGKMMCHFQGNCLSSLFIFINNNLPIFCEGHNASRDGTYKLLEIGKGIPETKYGSHYRLEENRRYRRKKTASDLRKKTASDLYELIEQEENQEQGKQSSNKVLGIDQSIMHRACHYLAFCCPIGRMIVNSLSLYTIDKTFIKLKQQTKNITSTIKIIEPKNITEKLKEEQKRKTGIDEGKRGRRKEEQLATQYNRQIMLVA